MQNQKPNNSPRRGRGVKTPPKATDLHLSKLLKTWTWFMWLGISSKCVVAVSFLCENNIFVIQLIPAKTDDMRQQVYISVSGAAVNSNKTGGFFEVNAPQYTSHYKSNRTLSILPVQARFNTNKYRTKKPIPSNNTYVSIEGFFSRC
jgi:hypothetical protein